MRTIYHVIYGREGWEDGESPMNSDARTGLPILEHR